MRIGVDFGTTRTVLSAVDRGNYPLLAFEGPDGEAFEWFPSLLAAKGAERVYGWRAWAKQTDPEWNLIRSLKRELENAGPHTLIAIGNEEVPLIQLLTEMAAAVRRELPAGRLETMLGIPANANGNQRFLTSEAFRGAGFEVIGLLNEPSAASVEYGHKNKGRGMLLVYDLGGGTFDASLVQMGERTHEVVASEGIQTLGGDDFDEILAQMVIAAAKLDNSDITEGERFRLLEECRARKEGLHPNTRKLVVDLESVRDGWGTAAVPASEFYERCLPLLEHTATVVEDLLERHGDPELEALYVTGGGSELPLVTRVLKERFGKRVKRSAHTRSATAIGLAIGADAEAGYVLRDQFTRYFGVWREGEAGNRILFDPLFPKGTALPKAGGTPLQVEREYLPVHNIGHFRYLECSQVGAGGEPAGDITVWDEIAFPYEKAAEGGSVAHSSSAPYQRILERYSCDASGSVTVRITNLTEGHEREYQLGRWAAKEAVTPGKKRKRAGSAA